MAFTVDVPWACEEGRVLWTFKLTAVILWTGGHFATLIPTADESHDFFLFDCLSKTDGRKGVGKGQRYNMKDAMTLLRKQKSQLWLYYPLKEVLRVLTLRIPHCVHWHAGCARQRTARTVNVAGCSNEVGSPWFDHFFEVWCMLGKHSKHAEVAHDLEALDSERAKLHGVTRCSGKFVNPAIFSVEQKLEASCHITQAATAWKRSDSSASVSRTRSVRFGRSCVRSRLCSAFWTVPACAWRCSLGAMSSKRCMRAGGSL